MRIDYRRQSERAQTAQATAPFHEWAFADGTLWTQFYRTSGGYLLRFPGVADFQVSSNARMVSCHPVPGADTDTVEHHYLNQVMPLVMSRRGDLVFHASAVDIDGRAVAFAAASGRGKSTLAALFSTTGFPFLTDDGLVLRPAAAGGFDVQPSHPSLRLWDDSRDALLPDQPGTSGMGGEFKSRIPAGNGVAFCVTPRKLQRAYFLGDGSATSFTCERMSVSEALVAWVSHSFLLDFDEPALLTSHFEHVVTLAGLPVSYRLDYPRRLDDLRQLQDTIIEHLREED